MRLVYLLMTNRTITQNNVDLIEDVEKKGTITFDKIRKAVSMITSIPPQVINAKTRKREIVEARQFCCYFSLY